MEEKWPLVSSQDYGEDEAGTTRLIKKHQVPCPEHPPHILDLGDDGPSEKLLSHFLLLRGTEPCSFFQKTQPAPSSPPTQIPQGPCSYLVPRFFRGNPFEGPISLFILCPNLSPWPWDFSAFSSCFLPSLSTFLYSFGVTHCKPLFIFHRVLLPPML